MNFVSGSRMLENVSLVEKANAEAQQHLQSLVQNCYPDDRLRYSKLLLSLYTLFGINCNMLESLFCRHLLSGGNGGLQKFILTEFLNKKCTDECWYKRSGVLQFLVLMTLINSIHVCFCSSFWQLFFWNYLNGACYCLLAIFFPNKWYWIQSDSGTGSAE